MALHNSEGTVEIQAEFAEDLLQKTRIESEIAEIKRKRFLTAAEDYVGFFTTKLSGLGLATVGAVEALGPEIIQRIVLSPDTSASMAAAGVVMLGGKQISSALGTLVDVMSKYREHRK